MYMYFQSCFTLNSYSIDSTVVECTAHKIVQLHRVENESSTSRHVLPHHMFPLSTVVNFLLVRIQFNSTTTDSPSPRRLARTIPQFLPPS